MECIASEISLDSLFSEKNDKSVQELTYIKYIFQPLSPTENRRAPHNVKRRLVEKSKLINQVPSVIRYFLSNIFRIFCRILCCTGCLRKTLIMKFIYCI